MLKKQCVIVGITGGVAAVKTPQLVKLLRQRDFQVECVLTESARNFVKIKAYTDLFPPGFDPKNVLSQRKVEHIELADRADLVLIAPATANFLAKLAHGLADDFLTTLILATKAPVVVCPAMNVNMWANQAVQDNLAILKSRGVEIIEPAVGMLACGYEGVGRLEELGKIVEAVCFRLQLSRSLAGKRILVTAGPTREPIDAVRFITNASSGKMGAALAEAARRRGASVKLLMGQKDFVTGDELLALIKKLAPEFEIIFQAAAVGDFSVKKQPGKLSSGQPANLILETQVKILEQIKKFNPQITVVSFKAEWGLSDRPLVQPGADVTIYNDVSRQDIGFAVDNNEVVVVLPDRQKLIKKALKATVAGKILDYLSRYYHW